MIITLFMRVIYPLKYLSNAHLSCLDNGPLLLECNLFRVSKCHRCLTSKQAEEVGHVHMRYLFYGGFHTFVYMLAVG